MIGPLLDHLAVSSDLCAIVNPSRGGLDERVVEVLRSNERIRSLVYVSCKPDGPALKNFVSLCRNIPDKQKAASRLQGEPFRLVRATPVDMFPQTVWAHSSLFFDIYFDFSFSPFLFVGPLRDGVDLPAMIIAIDWRNKTFSKLFTILFFSESRFIWIYKKEKKNINFFFERNLPSK